MRKLSSYQFISWVKLEPIKYLIKYIRNYFVTTLYVAKKGKNLDSFLKKCKHLSGKNIILIIAFEQPWVIEWQLKISKENIKDATIIIFDNSRDQSKKNKIKSVCHDLNALYFSLPKNKTLHVNRSHSLAMQWVYENVVKAIKPNIFAFIDHDLILIKGFGLLNAIKDQDFYGWHRGGLQRKNPDAWYLWAGYCMYNYTKIKKSNLYFMYDFANGLDTGGGNYDSLYHGYDDRNMNFSSASQVSINIPGVGVVEDLMVLDDSWHHIGSVGHNDNSKLKKDYVTTLFNKIEKGDSWDDFVISRKAIQNKFNS